LFSASADECSGSFVDCLFVVVEIILPHQAAGVGVEVDSLTTTGFAFSVYATNVDAEQV
jgi:hypothetical protein